MRKILISSLLFLFPSLLLADSLNPPAGDLSISYLATIFGVVDGILHGTGSEIIGTMFGAFNATVLAMASVLLSYVLFISILNTSHEGEFLGKKWSSIWVPLRTVTGIGLLLPKATGYSFVQIIVMWVVVQGVGAADQVWNVALNYLNRNGTIVEPIQSLDPKSGTGANNTFLISKAGGILKSEVCMLTVYNSLVHQYKGTGVPVPNFMNSLAVTGKGPNGQNTGIPVDYSKDRGGFISFPGKLTGTFANLQGMCGNLSWDFIGKTSDSGQVYNPAQLTANDSASMAARQMTLDLGSLAQSIANKLAPPYAESTVLRVKLQPEDPVFQVNGLVSTADDYFTIVKPALRSLADDASKKYKQFISQAKDSGWILAGSYYYDMARLNQSVRNNTGNLAINDKIFPEFSPNYAGAGFNQINDQNVMANLKDNLPAANGVIDNYMMTEKANAANNNNPGTGGDPSLPSNPANVNGLGTVVSAVLNTIFPRVQDFEKTLSDNINKKNMDPIFALVSVGNGLVSMVEQVWISILGVITGLGIAGIAAGFASGFWTIAGAVNTMLAITNLLMLIAPMLTVWMGINFVLGAVLSYYVPLIPFFLFTFGAITWFAVVLEAILAAPLVALGITHPEGHDFMGKAEQAIMLLSSVFLRPVLMVFGFIFGIILSFVALSVFNRGFAIAVQFLTEYNGDIFAVVYQTAMMVIYTAAVLAIINRSFAMIYEVPNKVLRWIGGPQESGHEESMLQGIRSQHDRDVGQIAQQMPTGQGMTESATGGMQLGRRLRELKQTKASSNNAPGGGGGAPGGGTP
ncbi:MAG: Dot/Icm secretion system protein DotA [Pseudomonadota bacterium]|jgi:defect-in-organelle-trafficking protein DotA